jgi:hypothetical protein
MAQLTDKIKEFLSTKQGKTIVIAAAAGVVLLIVLIAVAVFFIFGGTSQTSLTTTFTPTPSGTTSPTTGRAEATAAAAKGPIINQFYEVYEYKDPFRPLSVTEEATGGAQGPGTGDKNMVLDITTDQNGIRYASVRYNGQTYDVRVGDVLDRSAYKVLAIETDRVVFLYGDNQIEVEVGEELGERIGGSAAGK